MEKVTVDLHIENKEQDTVEQEEIDVHALTDTELRKRLSLYGDSPGPILPSTRTVYENKLRQLMKQSPAAAVGEKSSLDDCESENDGEKGITTEILLQNNNFRVTTECPSCPDNKTSVDEKSERQKKLLSPDNEHSLAKIVAELQEILPEGKMALHRSQGLRKKTGNSPETSKQKKSDALHIDYGHPDASSMGTSTRRRMLRETTPSVKKRPGPETKSQKVCEKPAERLIPMRLKVAVLGIFLFLFFVYVTMETNPFTSFFTGK